MGFEGFIVLTILGSYALYLLFLVAIGFFTTKKGNKGTRLVLVVLGLAPALIFFVFQEWVNPWVENRNNEIYGKNYKEYQEITKKFNLEDNLKIACSTESSLTINQKIPVESGIFYQRNVPKTAYFAEKDELYSQCLNNETLQMNKDWRQRYCRKKYLSTLSIMSNDVMSLYLREYALASNVEWIREYSDGILYRWQAKFSGYHIKNSDNTNPPIDAIREATRKWWVLAGQPIVAEKAHGTFRGHVFLTEVPVKRLMADFNFQIENLSTQHYRDKGLRKFRLSLTDRQTKQLLSEYIGFDVINFDMFNNKWNENDFSKNNCVSLVEPRIDEDFYHDNRTIINYFFSHAVDKNKTQPVPRIYHYP